MTRPVARRAVNTSLHARVGLVVAAAAGVLAWAFVRALPELEADLQLLLLVGIVAVPNAVNISIRVRSITHGVSPVSAAVLVCAALVPPETAILYAALGTLIAKWVRRQPAIKVSFNVAKETLSAAATTAALAALGFVPGDPYHGGRPLLTVISILAAGAVAYTVVDEFLAGYVLSVANRTPMRELVLSHYDIRLWLRLGSFAAALGALRLVQEDERLLIVMPVLLYAVHLASAVRLRARTEREAWQRLAEATDEFNSVDLDGVLHTAVLRAANLFSVDEVEVTIELADGARLVRGDALGVKFDGPADGAPPGLRHAIPIVLPTSSGQGRLGELRLLVRGGQIMLSERENYTFSTFAAALSTAIRNASTFAETKRLAESNARAAAIDPLTGLANRRRLSEYTAPLLAARPPVGVTALLLIDLNHFKEINDTLGHSAGDQVLVEAATRLAATAQPDDLVVRLGGDEFAILLVGLPAPALAVSRAHALLAALNPPMELDGVRLSVEACGGVAIATNGCDIEELLRRADIAMYQAKRDGQRVAVFAPARDTADVGSLALGGDLAKAIAEGQFTVLFQPIVELGSGRIVGAEALTRWAHPHRGNLAPNRFLDSVERSGQLPAFAVAVLDQALVAAASWADAGYELAVSVNVSPRSLLDPSFPDVVTARLDAHGLTSSSLVIELTETVTLSQLEVVDEVLGRLREMGVRLALDDFGTGYSSLATLARVPVHELKIDRSFVASLDSPTEAAVVRSTIELGRSLGLLVVAEGVESERQRIRLWELGCPTGQGHLFAKPMAPGKLLEALRTGTDGRPGALAAPLHETGAVIRIPPSRRARGAQSAEG